MRILRYDKGSDTYNLDFKVPKAKQDPKRRLTRAQLVDFWVEMSKKYPLVLLEDPFDENDWETFAKITALNRVPIIGDDLL